MYKNKNLIILIFSLVLFFVFYPDVFAQEISEFSCTDDYQEFIAPTYGNYKIELWGAAGGRNLVDNAYTNTTYAKLGGKGAYTSGVITLKKNEKIYVYVGCKGRDAKKATIVAGGYNGGGRGDHDHSDDEASGAGGGATDVRLVKGDNWDDFTSLKSRIMIAGGGGGASYELRGGNAGTLSGEDTLYSKGGTQTTGYKFGIGQDGVYVNSNVDVAGGGGGTSANFVVDETIGGSAGGYIGNFGEKYYQASTLYGIGYGGTQTSSPIPEFGSSLNKEYYSTGGFGYGANGIYVGGGGGFYGGSVSVASSGGGSGYIGNSLLTEKAMYCYNCQESKDISTKTISTTCTSSTPTANCSKQGNGYARITLVNVS